MFRFSLDFTRCNLPGRHFGHIQNFTTWSYNTQIPTHTHTHTSIGISPHTVRVTHFQHLLPTIQPSTPLLFFHLRNTQGLTPETGFLSSQQLLCVKPVTTPLPSRFVHVSNRNSSHGSPIGWGITSPGQDARLKEKNPVSWADCPPRH